MNKIFFENSLNLAPDSANTADPRHVPKNPAWALAIEAANAVRDFVGGSSTGISEGAELNPADYSSEKLSESVNLIVAKSFPEVASGKFFAHYVGLDTDKSDDRAFSNEAHEGNGRDRLLSADNSLVRFLLIQAELDGVRVFSSATDVFRQGPNERSVTGVSKEFDASTILETAAFGGADLNVIDGDMASASKGGGSSDFQLNLEANNILIAPPLPGGSLNLEPSMVPSGAVQQIRLLGDGLDSKPSGLEAIDTVNLASSRGEAAAKLPGISLDLEPSMVPSEAVQQIRLLGDGLDSKPSGLKAIDTVNLASSRGEVAAKSPSISLNLKLSMDSIEASQGIRELKEIADSNPSLLGKNFASEQQSSRIDGTDSAHKRYLNEIPLIDESGQASAIADRSITSNVRGLFGDQLANPKSDSNVDFESAMVAFKPDADSTKRLGSELISGEIKEGAKRPGQTHIMESPPNYLRPELKVESYFGVPSSLSVTTNESQRLISSAPISLPQLPEVIQRGLEQLNLNRAQQGWEATFSLHPEELGSLRVSLKVGGGDVEATIFVESRGAERALQAQVDVLRENLVKYGMNVASATVFIALSKDSRQGSKQDDRRGSIETPRKVASSQSIDGVGPTVNLNGGVDLSV